MMSKLTFSAERMGDLSAFDRCHSHACAVPESKAQIDNQLLPCITNRAGFSSTYLINVQLNNIQIKHQYVHIIITS